MKKRRIIGLLSVLIAFPNLFLCIGLLGWHDFPITHWLVLEKLSIIVCGIIGGVLLWNGRRTGYLLSIIAWLIVFKGSSSSLYYFYFGKGHLEANALLKQVWRNYALLGVIPSILILFILLRDLITSSKIQRLN